MLTATPRGGWGQSDDRDYSPSVATRTPTRPRPSTRSGGARSTTRPAARSGAARRAPARSSARRRRGASLPVRLGRALSRVVAAFWMLCAHAIGGLVRHLGGGARDLDPAHRRDGLGLAAMAGALIVAVGAWAGAGGPLGHGVTSVLRYLVGSAVMLLPPLLGVVAWRLLRRPSTEEPRGRVVIGWIALAVGVLGVLDLLHGDPTTQAGRRGAGGVLGVLAGSPVAAALTSYLAIPILLLVAGFGVLVLTGTPLHAVPDRLRALAHRGKSTDDSEDSDDSLADELLAEPKPKRRRRKKADDDLALSDTAPF